MELYALPLGGKLKHYHYALRQHTGLLALGFAFLLGGWGLAWFGSDASADSDWLLYIIGGAFSLPMVIILISLPSSVSYYYEKSLAKKYGVDKTARVTGKRIDEYNYRAKHGDFYEDMQEFDYIVEYGYTFFGEHEGEFILEEKDVFDGIEVGDEIPIRVLSFRPQFSYPRRSTLAKQLGLPRSRCS